MTVKAKTLDAPPREWPADAVERWPLGKIKPYPKNARLHSEEQVDQIVASMRSFGVTAPVLVDEAGVLIYGHGRLRAAEKLGLLSLPVMIAKGWSETEKAAYRIADNKIQLNSSWDIPLLAAEVSMLKLQGFDMPLLAFSVDELKIVTDGWTSDIDVRTRFGETAEGILVKVSAVVAQADKQRATEVVARALKRSGIKHEIV